MNRLDLSWIRQRLVDHQPRSIDFDTPHRAAVAAILRSSPLALFFIKRAKNEHDPWSGHMAFPGGRSELSDANLLRTACRETAEEVAINLDHCAELLGQLDEVQAAAGGRVLPIVITPFIFLLNKQVTISLSSDEVEEAHWVPITTLLDAQSADTVPWELAGQRYQLPGIQYKNRVIWGLTYQILMGLFSVLGWEVR